MVETTKVNGKDLSISTKKAIEICSFIRGMTIQRAKVVLGEAIKIKQPIPFKRFTDGAGHRKGKMAGGKYPVKACTEILKLIASVESNAAYKGMNKDKLILKHIKADKASQPLHSGRRRGIVMKRTHVEIVVEEGIIEKEKKVDVKK